MTSFKLVGSLAASFAYFAVAMYMDSSRPVQAAPINYSWSGTITPFAAGGDPLGLGGAKPFSLSFSLDPATTVNVGLAPPPTTKFAFFQPQTQAPVSLVIGGAPFSVTSRQVLNGVGLGAGFYDQTSSSPIGLHDSIYVLFEVVSPGGGTGRFFSSVDIAETTYTFPPGSTTTPPQFGTAPILRTISSVLSEQTYFTTVTQGSLVNAAAIPEPASATLWCLAITTAMVRCLFRKRSRANEMT